MDEHRPVRTDAQEGGSRRKGWDIVVVFVALHMIVGAKIATLGSRRPAATGDPMSLWVGLGFVVWGAAFLAAERAEDRSILFRLLNGTRAAGVVGWVLIATSAFLLGRYAGIL